MKKRNVYYENRKDRLRIDRGEGVARAYASWVSMRERIRNPMKNKRNGKSYVGVCIDPSWDDFEQFLIDMGERKENTTIDRIDCNGDYKKINCRWANAMTQTRNRSYTRLNIEAVKVIRFLYGTGKYTQQQLADAYRVSQVLISKVILNKVWQFNG